MKKSDNYIEYEDGTRVMLDENDSPEWTEEMFKKAKRGRKALTEIFGEKGADNLINRKAGRPKAENPKQPISFRFDADLVSHLKLEVKGYNRKVENIIRQAFEDGRL